MFSQIHATIPSQLLSSVSGAVTCRQQRYDPRAVITDIPDAEVQRGLYELVMRGLLPKTLDATAAFEGDVLALTGTASLFHCQLRLPSLSRVRLAPSYLPDAAQHRSPPKPPPPKPQSLHPQTTHHQCVMLHSCSYSCNLHTQACCPGDKTRSQFRG